MSDRNWLSRGNIPHCDHAGLVLRIVFGTLMLLRVLPKTTTRNNAPHAGTRSTTVAGACLLGGGGAKIVDAALLHFDGAR